MNWLKMLGNAALNGVIGYMAPIAVAWANGAVTGQPAAIPDGGTLGTIAVGAAILGVTNYLVKPGARAPEQQ